MLRKKSTAARRRPRVSVKVRAINAPKHAREVDAAKYAPMKRVVLRVFRESDEGLTQRRMFAAIKARIDRSKYRTDGVMRWWAKSVQLDLEARGELVRERGRRPFVWRLGRRKRRSS